MDLGMVAAELVNHSRPADELIGVLAQPKAPVVKLCLANAGLTWPVPGQRFLFFAQIQAPQKEVGSLTASRTCRFGLCPL